MLFVVVPCLPYYNAPTTVPGRPRAGVMYCLLLVLLLVLLLLRTTAAVLFCCCCSRSFPHGVGQPEICFVAGPRGYGPFVCFEFFNVTFTYQLLDNP